MNRPNWDTFFMSLAYLVSQRSPDEQTKVGAVLVDKNKRILSLGFNGFPRGCKDSELPTTRPDKYFYIIHAEDNCIMNAHSIPESELCTMYCTAIPCHECTKKIIQYGIGKIVYGPVLPSAFKEQEYIENRRKLLEEIKINFVEFDNSNTKSNEMVDLLDQTKSYILSNR
jgi:dCMP deaminase